MNDITIVGNPLLDAFEGLCGPWRDTVGSSSLGWIDSLVRMLDGFGDVNRLDRHKLSMRYSWAVPTDEALDAIAEWGPIVEVGAGTGYWAHLLEARGVDIVAYDLNPPGTRKLLPDHVLEQLPKDKRPPWHSDQRPLFDVQHGGAPVAALHPDRTLLLVWPCYNDPMAAIAVENHVAAGGKRLIYVGEGADGCTGDERFHTLRGCGCWCLACHGGYPDADHSQGCGVSALYREVDTVELPNWPGIHDQLYRYEVIA